MGALADSYALLKTGTLWASTGKCQGYAVANPAEARLIDAYVAALDAGRRPSPPALVTKTGKGIVGMLAALAPPPPVATVVSITGEAREGSRLQAAIR